MAVGDTDTGPGVPEHASDPVQVSGGPEALAAQPGSALSTGTVRMSCKRSPVFPRGTRVPRGKQLWGLRGQRQPRPKAPTLSGEGLASPPSVATLLSLEGEGQQIETPERAGGGASRPSTLSPTSLLCPKSALQQQVHSVDFSRLGGLYLFFL